MQRVILSTNVPVDVALQSMTGTDVRSRYKGLQRVFLTTDGRAVHATQQEGYEIEARLAELGINPGERILLYKERTRVGAVVTTKMNVYRAQLRVGQQPDGTFIVPRPPGGGPGRTKFIESPGYARIAPLLGLLSNEELLHAWLAIGTLLERRDAFAAIAPAPAGARG